jgi:hypothetical protein
MSTAYDIVAVLLFSGLVVLFLQRSVSDTPSGDSLWQYLVASVACAAVNYLGNQGLHIAAVALLASLIAFIHIVLRPLRPRQ